MTEAIAKYRYGDCTRDGMSNPSGVRSVSRQSKARGSWIVPVAATAIGVVGSFLFARSAVRRSRWMSLAGRSALITGGSRGLGMAMARELVRSGADVAICARDADELHRARAQLQAMTDREVFAIECDVTVPEQMIATVQTAARHFGGLDILINNAGRIQVGPLADQTVDDFETSMATHFQGPLRAMLTAVPIMKSSGGGRIVNIASIAGKIAVPHLAPYSASKFALVGLSEALRTELIADRIYVTTVCPGLVRTGSPRNAEFKGQAEKEYEWFATSDVLPGQSISADRLAKKIIRAMQVGDAKLIAPLMASLPAKLQGIASGTVTELLSLANRLLPAPGTEGPGSFRGREVDQSLNTFAKTRNDSAARENNEF